MNDLTPSYEAESGQVILDGLPAGPAGEAGLAPVSGVDLAFDRADGHLVRAILACDDARAWGWLARLFDPRAIDALRDAPRPAGARSCALSPEAGLCAALSNLARLDAARATSPVPASSPWWAAEAAVLAERAGLHARALGEARRAVAALSCGQVIVPGEAALVALEAAGIAVGGGDGDAVRALRERLVVSRPDRPGIPGLDVAAEIAGLARDCGDPPGPHALLDLGLVPEGLFRPGLSPHSDLFIGQEGSGMLVTVQAALMRGADRSAVGRCKARLVDPGVRRVLAIAAFEQVGRCVHAELHMPFPLEEPGQMWVEVAGNGNRRVRGSRVHRIQLALRWADAALRAERAPAGLAPQSAESDWAVLADACWERCRLEWAEAGDSRRAEAVLGHQTTLPEPSFWAEVLGA